MKKLILLTAIFLATGLYAAQNDSITSIVVQQRTDGSGLVDVSFTLTGSNSSYDIALEVSFDAGNVYTQIPDDFLTGDLTNITPGENKQIVWDGMSSFPDTYSTQSVLKITASWEVTCPPNVTDPDENVYSTVELGSQCWMAENLKTTLFRNGEPIDYPGIDYMAWYSNTTGAYAWYDNNIAWKDVYGALYNYHAVKSANGLCPGGWHVPTDAEFTTLSDYLGGESVAGGKMKSTRTDPDPHPRWNSPNTGATNESNWSAYPGGLRDYWGFYGELGTRGAWWTSTDEGYSSAWSRSIYYSGQAITRNSDIFPNYGLSIRCLKDEPSKSMLQIILDDVTGYSGFFTFDTRVTNVQGTISIAGSGNPVSGAMVTLTSTAKTYSGKSQSNGSYLIGNVPSGNYLLTVVKLGYEDYSQLTAVTGEATQTINISLTPGCTNCVLVNDSTVVYGDNITENPAGVHTLSGNVNINHVLYFDGPVMVDKRSIHEYPEISGDCGFFAKDIGSQGTSWIKNNNIHFEYYALDNRLIPAQWGYILNGSFMMGGFSVTIGELIVDPGFDYVEVKGIAQMPYPINKVIDYLQEKYPDDLPFFVQKVSGSRILSKTNGEETEVDISGLGLNLGIVQLEDVNLYFNTSTDTYGGGFTLRIPGSSESKWDEEVPAIPYDTISGLSVEIRNENQEVIDSMPFGEFVETWGRGGFKLVSLGAQIEFVQGAINKIIISIGTKIPLGTTGLFLTQVTGGVDDLATKNWKISASVDIELGYEVPVLGSPIKLDNFGILIQPWNVFKGGGEFKVFDYTVSEGYIEYNRPLSSLSAECKVNLYGGILKGRTYFGLVGGHANGSGTLSVHTPSKSSLPWYLRWAGNKKIGSAQASFSNKYFQSSVRLWFIKFAQKLVFGKTSFPWFHYYLGSNLNKLHKIWKGTKDGHQAITFTVPENSRQLLVVAMDTLEPALFNFSLRDPSGKVYGPGNAYYYELNAENQQTLMTVLNPATGEWDFLTDYQGNPDVDISITNQEATFLVSEPAVRRTRSNRISLCFSDYADTMDVQVYYDRSNKHFNGKLIQDFRIINNGALDFEWQNQDVPNGEYYIYCRVDDGYNSPYLQYAPGSIRVENEPVIESPGNFTVVQQYEGLLARWNKPFANNIAATAVYARNITTGRITEETVSDTSSLVFKNLEYGQEYQFWACFITGDGVFSDPGDKVNIVFKNPGYNNPPYFKLDPDSSFVFIEGEQKQYKLTAGDADGDILMFQVPGDTLGISIFSDNLIWTPAVGDRGVYYLLITVTDGYATDTIAQPLIVYASHEVDVNLAFSSKNLYESDNMFVKISNYACPDLSQPVTLKNIRTQEQATIETRRVNDFEYLGQFSLSVVKRSDIQVKNGDTLEAKYSYKDKEYVTHAYYDSLPQPSDITPPGSISDLAIERIQENIIKLKWTATGNDLGTGKAFRYDIRYAYGPISSEDVYYSAYRILEYPYPSAAGMQDSLLVNLSELEEISQHSMVYFSIKAVDEMQNRGGLSNSPWFQYISGTDAQEASPRFFTIRPNPTGGIFTLELNGSGKASVCLVEIFDMTGEILTRTELEGQRAYQFDLSAKPAGIYLIRVTRANEKGAMMVVRK